jgi:hypothetical protein
MLNQDKNAVSPTIRSRDPNSMHFKSFKILEPHALHDSTALRSQADDSPVAAPSQQPLFQLNTNTSPVDPKEAVLKDMIRIHLISNKEKKHVYEKCLDLRKTGVNCFLENKISLRKMPEKLTMSKLKIKPAGIEENLELNIQLLHANRKKIFKENKLQELKEHSTSRVVGISPTPSTRKLSEYQPYRSVDLPQLSKRHLGDSHQKHLRFSQECCSTLDKQANPEVTPTHSRMAGRQRYESTNEEWQGSEDNIYSKDRSVNKLRGIRASQKSIQKSVKDTVVPDEEIFNVDEEEQKKQEQEFFSFMHRIQVEYRVIYSIVMKPPSRERTTLAKYTLGGKEYLLVYGGIGYEIFSDIWTISMPSRSTQTDKEWICRSLSFDTHVSDSISLFQSSLSMTSIQGKPRAYIFGGILKLGSSSFTDFPNNTLYKLDLETFHAKKVIVEGKASPSARKHHSSCVLDDVLIIVGGVDLVKEEPLAEVWRFRISKLIFNLASSTWARSPLVLGDSNISTELLSMHEHRAVAIPSTSKSIHARRVQDL